MLPLEYWSHIWLHGKATDSTGSKVEAVSPQLVNASAVLVGLVRLET